MTEKQKEKINHIAFALFCRIDNGYTVRDDEDNVVVGLRKGLKANTGLWNYQYYNNKKHLVSRPVAYCDNKELKPCKKFVALKCGKKKEIIK